MADERPNSRQGKMWVFMMFLVRDETTNNIIINEFSKYEQTQVMK